jgi:hypothetical protein
VKKFLVLIATLLFTTTLFAQQTQVDVSRLTEEQRQALQQVANQMAEDDPDTSDILEAVRNIDAEQVQNWAEAGTEAGRAVANFSREVGVVAGEFLDSDVGKTAFVLLTLNYGGGAIVQYVLDVALFVALLPVFIWLMCRVFKRFVLQVTTLVEREYHQSPLYRFIGFNKVTKKDQAVDYDDEAWKFWSSVLGYVIIFVSTLSFFGTLYPAWV